MTVINRTHRFIFIHIPKTGGTSVKEHLRQYHSGSDLCINRPVGAEELGSASGVTVKKHSSAIEVREALGAAEFDRFFKFCVVRNPFIRTISLFRFLKFNFRSWPRSAIMDQIDSLADFVTSPIFRGSGPGGIVSPQVHWFVDKSGTNCVDYIARIENLEEDFRNVGMRLGLSLTDTPLRRRNQSLGNVDRLTDELMSGMVVDAIRNRYAADFQLLEYSTEPTKAVELAASDYG